jgi:hypothetical protein
MYVSMHVHMHVHMYVCMHADDVIGLHRSYTDRHDVCSSCWWLVCYHDDVRCNVGLF